MFVLCHCIFVVVFVFFVVVFDFWDSGWMFVVGVFVLVLLFLG